MQYVRSKKADKKRLVVAITALVLLLAISYIAVGGIVWYVIKMTKDTQVAKGSTQLTDTAGNTLHVMSSINTATSTALSSLDSDNAFNNLVSATLSIGGMPIKLNIAGFARSATVVLLFTTSSAIPVLVLSGTTLSPGPGVSDSISALLTASAATISTGARALETSGTCTSSAGSCVAVEGGPNPAPLGAHRAQPPYPPTPPTPLHTHPSGACTMRAPAGAFIVAQLAHGT